MKKELEVLAEKYKDSKNEAERVIAADILFYLACFYGGVGLEVNQFLRKTAMSAHNKRIKLN